MSDDKSKAVVSRQLSDEELREFREIFDLVDADRGGTISSLELKQLMKTLGLNPTDDEIEQMILEVDEDGSGDIDFDEFVAVMSRKVETNYSADELEQAFKLFEDDNGPGGFVSTEVLEHALTTYGTQKLTAEEAAELLSTVDPEGVGRINYMQYVNMMK